MDMHEFAQARMVMETMIRGDDLEGLLRQVEHIHGHLCPGVSLGVKAGHYAMKAMDRENTGMEELVAIVECNNCFTDGIQVVTGCTFGNNSLIFKDLGKTAVTVARREDGFAVRLALKPDYLEQMFSRYPVAGPLFQKIVAERQGTPEEVHHFQHVWHAISHKELKVPLEEQFTTSTLTITPPRQAPILASQVCSLCGESVMESRLRLRQGKPLCLTCAGEDYFLLTGHGMTICRDSGHG
jgi:formylmethanofuran dehydrogenase subunit E